VVIEPILCLLDMQQDNQSTPQPVHADHPNGLDRGTLCKPIIGQYGTKSIFSQVNLLNVPRLIFVLYLT